MFTTEQLLAIEQQRQAYQDMLSKIDNELDLDRAWSMVFGIHIMIAGEFNRRANQLKGFRSEHWKLDGEK